MYNVLFNNKALHLVIPAPVLNSFVDYGLLNLKDGSHEVYTKYWQYKYTTVQWGIG